MMTPDTITRFAKVYNDVAAYPTLSDVARELGVAHKTVKNQAAIIRRLRRGDGSIPELVSRANLTRPVGEQFRDIATSLPDPDEPIETLIERACQANDRLADWHRARNVVQVRIKTPGPFGVVGLPDNHLNNPGTHLRRVFQDADLIAQHPALYAVAVGDWLDNFIVGRLERERRGDIMSHDDSWRLLEHYVATLMPKLVAAISGNHMDWSKSLGGVDVLKRMFEDAGLGPIYDTDEIRVELISPDGTSWLHKVRHKYRGHSKYNQVHGILVDMLENWQGEDVFWGGHIHTAGHLSIQKKWAGESRTVRGVQLGAYKLIDGYARQEGFRENTPFLVPMVVHDPAGRRTLFFEDMRDGLRHLDMLRSAAGSALAA
jgi:hypothetical protein